MIVFSHLETTAQFGSGRDPPPENGLNSQNILRVRLYILSREKPLYDDTNYEQDEYVT